MTKLLNLLIFFLFHFDKEKKWFLILFGSLKKKRTRMKLVFLESVFQTKNPSIKFIFRGWSTLP